MFTDYKGIKLEQPIFYNNKFGLRFEIGPSDIDIYKGAATRGFNEAYFDTALIRALSIFEEIFNEDDDVSIIYQVNLNRRNRIRKSNFIFKQIKDVEKREVVCTKYRSLDTEYYDCISYRMNKTVISGIKTKGINVKNIFIDLINTDFGTRNPLLKGRCLLVNHTRALVLDLYDDRGMDIVASKKSTLNSLYETNLEFILDYDRKRIDEVYSKPKQ